MITRRGEGAMDNNYLFDKKSDFVNISEEKKDENINSLMEISNNLTTENAQKSVWATNKIVNDMEHTGAKKLTDIQKVRLKELNARSTAANILYTQKGSDSVEMGRIKYYVEGVELLLANERDKVITEKFADELDCMLNLACVSCSSYINNKKKRENDRKSNVRMVYQSICFEISRLHAIKEEIKEGKLANKKVSDIFVTIKGDIPKAKYYKKPEPGKTISAKARKAMGFFGFPFDPYRMLKAVAGKPAELKKACKGLRYIKNTLRSFSKNRADSAELELNGSKVIILQKPDNSLYIVDNNVEQPLDLPADIIIDRIESEIIEHEENYGDYAVREIFLDINPRVKTVTADDLQRINRLCVSYVGKMIDEDDNDFGNVSPELLFKWARGLATGTLTAEKVKEQYNQMEKDLLEHVNDTVLSEMNEKVKDKVENNVKIVKEEEEIVEDEKTWSKDERAILDLIADMFFDSNTMSADVLTDKKLDKSNSLRKRLGKHKNTFLDLMNDPSPLFALIKRLPLPDLKIDFGNRRMTLKDYMTECFRDVFESDAIATVRDNFILRNAMLASFNADNIENIIFVGKGIHDMFDSVASAVEQMVTNVTGKLQSVAKEISDNTFDRKDDLNFEEPTTLNGMLDKLTRGGAAQGKFNKNIMSNYFNDASFMDKRSMMASMVRNAKPEASLVPTDAELIEELKEMPENRGYFRSPNYLSYTEKRKLDNYRHEKTQTNVCISLLGGMLKGAGPLMQKMVQGLPESILPSELNEAIKDMKSNLNPIPENVVKIKMAAIVESSGGTISSIQIDKSLGAASIGQAFLCTVYGDKFKEGKKVVIKLLRSDARNRMQREAKLMKKYATDADKSGSVLKSYKGQLKGIMKEFDLMKEAKNVKDGQALDGKLPNVEAMKLSDIANPGSDFVILELAEGETVDRYLKNTDKKIDEIMLPFYKETKVGGHKQINRKQVERTVDNKNKIEGSIEKLKNEIVELEKRRDHVLSVCEVTMKEAIMGSGFFHGDLHSGNIMVTDKKATVIDFGNAVHLSKKLSKWITALSVSAMTSDSKLFLESFEAILKEENANFELTRQQKDQLRAEFRRILSMGSEADMGERLMVCMLKAQDMGYTIPTSIFNFAQGQMRLMNTVNEMNEKIDKIKNSIGQLQKITYKNDEIPGNSDKDYRFVMQKMVSDRQFAVKLAMNLGGSLSKKVLNSLK